MVMNEFERRGSRSMERALLVGPCVALFSVVLLQAWVAEDAYITFRVVDNFVHGYGLRWNIDERVQVYTHPLWMLLHVVPYWLSGNIFLTTIALSLACTVGAVVVAARARPTRAALTGALWFAPLSLSKAFTEYATSGLESPLSCLLFAAFMWVLFRPRETGEWLTMSVLTALAGLNRLDTMLVFLPAIVWQMARARGRLPWLKVVLGMMPLVAWEGFSLVYYGFVFPNTKYAKLNTGIAEWAYVHQGGNYLLDLIRMDFFSAMLLVLGGIAAAVQFVRRQEDQKTAGRAVALLSVAAGGGLYSLYVVSVGGDYMSGRFWVLPIFVATWLLYASVPAISPRAALAILAAFLVLKIIAIPIAAPVRALSIELVNGSGQNQFPNGIADERVVYAETNALFDRELRPRSNIEPVLRNFPERVVVLSGVGMVGFYAGPHITIIDGHAITDPLLARLPPRNLLRWRIGHLRRRVPSGYVNARQTGSLAEMEPGLAAYYAKLRVIVADDVWSWSRLRTIAEFNLGRYDHLLPGHS